MTKTLVSFVGTGKKEQKKDELETYILTEYRDGNKKFETALFVESLINFRQEITNCVLIGTHGSSWGALLEKIAYNNDEYVGLYDDLERAFRSKSVDKTLLTQLAKALTCEWNIEVKCELHDSEITEEKVLPVFYQYVATLEQYKEGTFLLDVTHSLRSMPLIMLSALPTLESVLGKVELEIVYGELLYNQKNENGYNIGMVRSLAAMWQAQKFNLALRQFNTTFDGDELSKWLEKDWKIGSVAIKDLGSMVQANYVTQLKSNLLKAKEALKEFNQIKQPSYEAKIAANLLNEIVEKLCSSTKLHEQIFSLAELLKERRLWGQATTTLLLSFEAYLFHYYQKDEHGDYKITEKLFGDFLNECSGNDNIMSKDLRNSRNAIAHGGSRSNKGEKPKVERLPSQYASYANWLKNFYASK